MKTLFLVTIEAVGAAGLYLALVAIEVSLNWKAVWVVLPAFWLGGARVLWMHLMRTGGPELSDRIGTAIVAGAASAFSVLVGIAIGVTVLR